MRNFKIILASATLCAACAAAQAQSFDMEPGQACENGVVKFTNTSSANFLYAHFDFGDGTETYTTKDQGNTLMHIYREAKDYNIKMYLLLEDGSKSAEESKVLSVGKAPTVELVNDKAMSMLSASADGDAKFEWFNGKGVKLDVPANSDSKLFYYDSDTYTVVATGSNGCTDTTALKVVYVGDADNDATIIKVTNNVITPGVRDGINDILFIEDLDEYSYPCSVKIFTKTGKLVYSNDNYSLTNGFQGMDDNGNDLFAGTYFYVIKSQGRKGCTGFVDIIR